MLNLTKKQVFFILLLSIVPLIGISVIISLTMESVKNDLSELTERYSGEAREREIENARVRYLSGEGGELLSTYTAVSSKLDNISSAYTTLFGEATGTFPGEWRGPYLYHFTNSSFNLTLPDAVFSGKGEIKCNGAVQLRGVFTLSGDFTGHMEGPGHIVVEGENGTTYSGEVSASINGPVVGTLGRSLWNSSSGCRDALVDGSGEVCLSGEFYGHISGSVSLLNYSGYVLIPTPHPNLPGVNKTDIIENVERLGKILSTTGFLPESKLELLLPVEGGMLPINYSRPFIMTLFTSLPSWSLSDNQTFLSPPPGLYPSGTWYVISDPGEDNMRFAVRINTAGLSKYISQNIPGDYQVLTSPPPVHYENEGYSFKPSNYTLSKGCKVAKAERGNEVLWVIYRNESLYGIYIVRVVSDDEMSS
ncbi:MAG: hypothetical protein J7L88_04990, partial [Thermoplasmata archaeon]|nr:hypothetical protein [Thermoplasmata archaeon]